MSRNCLVVLALFSVPGLAFGESRVYVTNSSANFVSVVDPGRGNAVRRIDVGNEPFGVAFSPDGLFSYIANAKSSTISVIRTSTERVEQSIQVGTKLPVWLAISRDGSYAYVTNEGTHDVSVLAPASSKEVGRIRVGRGPAQIVISKDGRRAYVANEGTHNVSVVDLQLEVESRAIPVGLVPQGLALTSAGDRLYSANFGSDSVSIIDTVSESVIDEIHLRDPQSPGQGVGPIGIAISPDSKRIFTTCFKSGILAVIDLQSNRTIHRIPTGPEPFGVVFDSDSRRIYVASSARGELLIIDPVSLTVSQSVDLGKGIFKLAVQPEPKGASTGNVVFATLLFSGLLILVMHVAMAGVISRNQEAILLAGIFLLALSLRARGLDWGIPVYDRETALAQPEMRVSYHMDEDNFLWNLTRLRPESFDFYVPDFHWGTLQYYLIEAALLLAETAGYVTRPWREAFLTARPGEYARLFVTGRVVSALLGSLSILVMYFIVRKISGARAGLWAALLLALVPLHVVNSHYLTPDVTMLFFLLLAFGALLRASESPTVRRQLVTGVFFGLAVATKYNAIFLLPVVAIAGLLRRNGAKSSWIWTYLGAVVGFLAGEPYVLPHAQEFWGTIRTLYQTTAGLPEGAVPSRPALAVMQVKNMAYFGIGAPLSAGLLLLGAAAAFRKRVGRGAGGIAPSFALEKVSSRNLWLCGMTLASFCVSLFCVRQPMIRYTLPIVVFSVIPIALALNRITQSRPGRILACIIVLCTGLFSYPQVSILTQDHTANEAFRWVNLHLAPGASIAKGWPEIPVLNGSKYRVRNFYTGERMVDFRNFFLDSNGGPYYPDYVLLDDLAFLEIPSEFDSALAANYDLVADFRRDPELFGARMPERDAPHDWKYSHPRIKIHRRKTIH